MRFLRIYFPACSVCAFVLTPRPEDFSAVFLTAISSPLLFCKFPPVSCLGFPGACSLLLLLKFTRTARLRVRADRKETNSFIYSERLFCFVSLKPLPRAALLVFFRETSSDRRVQFSKLSRSLVGTRADQMVKAYRKGMRPGFRGAPHAPLPHCFFY